jgi:hypothetical protein
MSATTPTVTMGTSVKGNPIIRIGAIILNRACASTMLDVLNNPSELATLRTMLVELVGLQAIATAEKAAKQADKIEKATPPPMPSLTPSETIAAIVASQDVVKEDRKAMRGKPRPQVLPTPQPIQPVKPIVPIQEASTSDEEIERDNLISEGKSLGMKAIGAYGLKMDLNKLRDKVAASRPVTKPTLATAIAPAVKPTRTLIFENLVELPDGRELYTAVYSDDTIVNEISGEIRKVA